RKTQKRVEVEEEQKKALENQLHFMRDVEAELRNLQIQKQVLEDEQRSWASLLQTEGQRTEFESPEAVVRALVQERIENASLVDKVGNMQSEIAEKNQIIKNLEEEKINLQKEIEKLRANGGAGAGAESRAKTRLDRQRV